MITDNLTNAVYFSSLLPEKCPVLNAHITEALQKRGIVYGYLPGTKDIWCRDYMPIQIEREHFVQYKYTPDYLQDKIGLRIQTNPEEVFQTEDDQLQSIWQKCSAIDLVIDGGNVVKCGDVVVMTDKVFEENTDKSRNEVEQILQDAFQGELLFVPFDRNGDKYGLGHSDGIVHYIGNGKILLTNYDDFSTYFFRRYRKALEARFEVTTLKYKSKRIHARSWAYINYLQIGSLVLVPQLGLEEDAQALEQISNTLPECEVIGLPALEAVRRGGALNCISWNIQI